MNTIQYSPEAIRYIQQVFPGPTRVHDANSISIASAVFAGLTRWQTDWQTDRPRYSVGNNRRAHSGEANICYCLCHAIICFDGRCNKSSKHIPHRSPQNRSLLLYEYSRRRAQLISMRSRAVVVCRHLRPAAIQNMSRITTEI